MNTLTLTTQTTFEIQYCKDCGISYALPDWWIHERREKGGIWHCPNGHQWVQRVSDNERLRNELAEKTRLLTASKCETLKERQLREEAERKNARVANGVCPCCNRSFVNLQRHMKTKHPTFTK